MDASDQPLDEIVTNSKPTSKEEWFNSLQKAIEDGKALRRQHKIQRVAKVLRDKNQDCFEPIAVSIGPYHRNKPHLQRMEKLKAPMLWQYVEALDCTTKELLYHEVEKVAAEARECYAEDATEGMNEEDFTRMMFIDGCFFLQFIKCKRGIQMTMTRKEWVCVKRDLFLLENQLPFIVLEALSQPSSDPVEMMMNFIDKCNPLKKEQPNGMMDFKRRLSCNSQRKKEQSKTEGEPIHLLQLLRQSFLNPEDLRGKQSGNGGVDEEEGDGADNDESDTVFLSPVYNGGYGGLHKYRSVTERKKVGISFRKSQSQRFTDVGFRNNLGLFGMQGELRLPPMCVGDDTKSRLLNLVAYEMCADVPEEDADVTSYLCFLHNMIDSAEDVMELRSQGILINNSGSDQQVADLFNAIAEDLVANPDVYASVNQQIEKHCKNKLKISVAIALYSNFEASSSGWKFYATFLALFLAYVQTLCAIKAGKKD